MEHRQNLGGGSPHTSLADLTLLTRRSSDGMDSAVYQPASVSTDYAGSSEEPSPRVSYREVENQGLNVQFASIIKMMSNLVRGLIEVNFEKNKYHVSTSERYRVSTLIQPRLQTYLLELRIWSQDLTYYYPSFLQKIDELSSISGEIMHLGSRLSRIFKEVLDILSPFSIGRDLDEIADWENLPHPLVEGCFHTTALGEAHRKPCSNVSSLARACDRLQPHLKRLLYTKTAIRGILRDYKDLQGVEDTYPYINTKILAAPNVLSFGMLVGAGGWNMY